MLRVSCYHDGHLVVHEHDVEQVLVWQNHVQGNPTILRGEGRDADLGKQRLQHLAIGLGVLKYILLIRCKDIQEND